MEDASVLPASANRARGAHTDDGHRLAQALTAARRGLVALERARTAAQAALGHHCDARDDLVASLTLPGSRPPSEEGSGTNRPDVDPDVWRLHVSFARSRDPRIRSALVAHYDPHTRSLARRFYRNREPLDDLVQVAREGLLVAIDRFDPRRSLPFPSFANPTIAGSLKRYYRDSGWGVRVPRRVHDLSKPARRTADHLAQVLGRSPTVREVADELAVGEEHVLEALAASEARFTASLDTPVGEGSGTLGSSLGSPDPALADVENRAALRSALRSLPSADRQLLERYFADGMTQAEIAKGLGVSQMQVSRLLASAIRRLRARM